MTLHFTAIPPTPAVSAADTYVCKYCGARVPLGRFIYHRCR